MRERRLGQPSWPFIVVEDIRQVRNDCYMHDLFSTRGADVSMILLLAYAGVEWLAIHLGPRLLAVTAGEIKTLHLCKASVRSFVLALSRASW